MGETFEFAELIRKKIGILLIIVAKSPKKSDKRLA
jgi:hypothetical protein